MRLKSLNIKINYYIMPTTSHVEQHVIKQKKKSMTEHLKEHLRRKSISKEGKIIANQARVIDELREENTQLKIKLYQNETFAKTLEEKIIRAKYILFSD